MVQPVPEANHLQNAHEAGLKAIDFLLGHDIPPAPLNYWVAYEFLQGTRRELNAYLESHLGGQKPLDEILLQHLFDRFITNERGERFQGVRNDLYAILQSLLATITETSDASEGYKQELESNLDKLRTQQDQRSLQNIAADMITAAVASQLQNGKLQARLQDAHKETEQLREELEAQRREAMVDHLTGLFNRRAMDYQLGPLWDDGQNFSVLLMDIDHFKTINDNYGHAVGDIVIRNVADVIRRCIRGEDLAIRYGGEEFLVILPNTHLQGAITVAETIRKRIEALRLVRRNDNFALAPFTISLGVANRQAEDDQDSLLERADKALYRAKSLGRNQVVDEAHLE